MRHQANLTDMFETACRWVADRPFLIDDRSDLSGTDAARAVRQAAARLRRHGLMPGDVVAFLCGPSSLHAVAFFAILRAGGVACALHARDTAPRLERTIAEVKPRFLIADEGHLELAHSLAASADCVSATLSLDDVAKSEIGAEEGQAHPALPNDLAAIILSSGTTGRPKQVLHTHATLTATAMMAGPVYGVLGPSDSMVVPMAPSFAAWIHTVLPLVTQRCTIVFQRRYDTDDYVQLLEDHGVSIAALVPSLWRMVLPALARRDLPRLRVAMFSGEPGTADLVGQLRQRVGTVRGVYLASEGGCGCGIVADELTLGRDGMSACAGQPVPGADMRIVDPERESLRELPLGETGEIALRGPSLSVGYHDDLELTARRFQDGWWRSGDYGFIDGDRMLHMRGRLDNRINSGGIKIHAEEIEAALLQLSMVRQAAVVGVPDTQWGERVEAHLTLAGPQLCTEAEIAAAFDAATTLPRNLRPKRFHIHDALPLGPTGKLYRRALTERTDA